MHIRRPLTKQNSPNFTCVRSIYWRALGCFGEGSVGCRALSSFGWSFFSAPSERARLQSSANFRCAMRCRHLSLLRGDMFSRERWHDLTDLTAAWRHIGYLVTEVDCWLRCNSVKKLVEKIQLIYWNVSLLLRFCTKAERCLLSCTATPIHCLFVIYIVDSVCY